MESKTRLLASSGKEFAKPAGIFKNAAEVRKARKAAMGRLGLDFLDDVADNDDMDLDRELAAADDLDADAEMKLDTPKEENGEYPRQGTPMDVKAEPSPVERIKSATPAPSEDDLNGLSARERNRLKRKRKPGNSAFVAAPPPQASGSKFSATAAGGSSAK